MHTRLLVLAAIAAIVPISAQAAGGPITIGEIVEHQLETTHPYPSSDDRSPRMVWADQITHPGATYISVHFAKMDLAEGDSVVVRSPDGTQSWKYTGYGRHDLGNTEEGFFATHIKGDTAVIELFANNGTEGFGYVIDAYGRGYNDAEILDFWERGLGEKMNLPYPESWGESVCTADDTEEAKCYKQSESEAYENAKAVARLVLSGSAHCTGWLVGNEGHLMTNEHCITSQSQMNNIDFEFMAEGPDCATDCSSSLACAGTIEASGGTFVTDDADLDYALVIPDTSTGTGTDLPATYGFMKLRQEGATLDERIYIVQHPAGWGKRFAMVSSYPADDAAGPWTYASSLSETACSGTGYNDVGYWADTQGGSSGSPVLGYADHKVVALHHCRGSAGCASGSSTSDDPNRGVPIQLVIADLDSQGLLPDGSVCDAFDGPQNATAVANGDNRIDVSWDAVGTPGVTYTVYRSFGTCPGTVFEPIQSGLTTTSFSDTDVSGLIDYSYQVTAIEPTEGCESDPSPCATATATGACTLEPDFDGAVSATNVQTTACGILLEWAAATANCGSGIVYNVYRSETSGFTPDPGSLLASCVVGTTYLDATVESGMTYHYIVQAEDESGNGAGACASGNQEGNVVEVSAFPSGPDTVFFSDDLESGTSNWIASDGPNDTGGHSPWALSTTDANSPTNSMFVADEDPADPSTSKDQVLTMASPADLTSAAGGKLLFWHRYNTETGFDGGVLEYSTDGGTTWYDILEGNGGSVPANANRFVAEGYNDTFSTSFNNPLPGRDGWSGDSGGWVQTEVDLADFSGQMVTFRFRMGCDSSVSDEGWYIDDVQVIQGSPCFHGLFADGFETGDHSIWSEVMTP
jgi:hypothetical protein